MQQGGKAAFVNEGAHERAVSQLGENLRCNPSGHEHAAQRQRFERQVACFRPVDRDKEIEGSGAEGVASGERDLRDHRAWVYSSGQALLQPGRLASRTGIPQEAVNVVEPGSGQEPFVAHMTVFFSQETQQSGFQIGARGEIDVSPFGGDDGRVPTDRHEDRFPQAGPSSNEREVARTFAATLQHFQFVGTEAEETVSCSFEIVDQPDPGVQGLGKLGGVQLPDQVGDLALAVDDRSSDREAGGLERPVRRPVEEYPQDSFQGRKVAAGIARLLYRLERLRGILVEGHERLSSANITGQNHSSVSLYDTDLHSVIQNGLSS